MWINQAGSIVIEQDVYTAPDGTAYPGNWPKANIPGLTWVEPNASALAAQLAQAKAAQNTKINAWRAAANASTFTHLGKVIAFDDLSNKDFDKVVGSIALTGAFPQGFPGAWKAVDNTYLPMPDVAAFKSMYASMTAQGTANFNHSQALKTAVAAATTVDAVNAVVW